MFKILIALVPSLIFFLTCYGQNNYIINFDTAGRLKTPLPERINNNDNLSFRINESGENFNIYTDQLKNKIKRALNHIDKLLKDPNGMRLLKDVYDIQVPELNLVRTELNSILFFYNLQLGPPKHFPSFYRMLFFYYLQLGGPKYVPFLSTGNSNYYTVKPVHSTSITPLKFGPNINSASLSTALNSGEKELDFTLTKTDPYKKLLYEWLKKSSSDFVTRPNFLALAQQKKLIETEINSIQDFLALLKKRRDIRPCGFQRVDIQFLITSTTTADRLTQETNKIFTDLLPMLSLEKNKDWILKWLWYQDNNKLPLLNPFPFRTEESFGEEPDTTELSDLRLKIMARNEFYKNMDLKKFSVKQLDSLIDETRLLKRSMSEIQKNSKQYSDKIDKNEKNIRVFGTTSQLLNNGIFYISDIEKKNLWMRHHDASDGYQLINDIETGEYLEDDLIVLLSHNLLTNQRTDLHLSFQDIANDESLLSEQARSVMSKLKTFGLVASSLKVHCPPTNHAVKIHSESLDSKIIDLKRALSNAEQYIREVDYLLSQSVPVTDIKELTDNSSTFHSQVANPIRNIQGPKKTTYYMGTNTTSSSKTGTTATVSSTNVDTFHYRINKLYRIFPMAGFAYSFAKFNSIIHDNGIANDKNIADQHIHFIVGVKVFIKKTDIRNTKFFLSKDNNNKPLWPSRTSINIAFDASRPLNNLYIGGGLDLWPGFCINTGLVFNLYTYNVYSNNELINSKKLYRPGFYAGVTTDISLFTDIAKFLTLIK